VASLFPSHWIHIGADEVSDSAWLGSPLARRFMQQRGWREVYQVQSHFLRRVQEMIRGLGRGTGAWQEAALGAASTPMIPISWPGTMLSAGSRLPGKAMMSCSRRRKRTISIWRNQRIGGSPAQAGQETFRWSTATPTIRAATGQAK